MLATHLMDDAVWDNTNPWDISLEDINGTEALVNIHGIKESITSTTTLMSSVYNKI